MKRLFLVLLVGLFMISLASAQTLYNDLGNGTSAANNNVGSGDKYAAFIFNASTTYQIEKVQIQVSDVTGDTGNINASIMFRSGSAVPNGTVVSNYFSDTIASSSMSASNYYNFTFTNKPVITAGQPYAVVFAVSDAGAGTYIRLGETAGSPTIWYTTATDIAGTYAAQSSVATINIKLFGTEVDAVTSTLDKPLDNAVSVDSSVAFNSSTTKTGNNVDLRNATLYIWNSAQSIFNETTNTITNSSSNSLWNVSGFSIGAYTWNVYACGQNSTTTICDFDTNRTLTYGIANAITNYSLPAYELQTRAYNVTFNTTASTIVGNLIFNGTAYSGTATNLGGTNYIVNYNYAIPSGDGKKNLYWNLLLDGVDYNTSNQQQTITLTNISLCNYPHTVPFLNFTFKNETVAQETINASVTSSSWTYWLDSQSNNKTLSYSTTAENKEYVWCATPPSETFNVDLSFSYDNAEAEQRTYNPSTLSLTNTTSKTTLWLLPTSDGFYVTFQVITAGEQAIEDALVTITRSGFGTIGTQYTDAGGLATFWLNPNYVYTVSVEKTGYTAYTTSLTPTQSSYTITLGGSGTTTVNDYTRGITYTILPSSSYLANNTAYTFEFNITSSYWGLDSYGFTLQNASGYVLGSASNTGVAGGSASTSMNTGTNNSIVMNYYWVVEGNYSNGTISWFVWDDEGTNYGWKTFFTDLASFADDGIFGMNRLALTIILFIVIFVITGVMSYKFGFTSPGPIMGVVFALVLFLDVGVNLIPSTVTFFVGALLIASIIWEVTK